MTNLCKVTVAMLSLAIVSSVGIAPSHADTLIMKRQITTTSMPEADVMFVPEERVLVQPMVIPQIRTHAAVVTETSTPLSKQVSVQTRYGDVRTYEHPAGALPSTSVELF